MVTFGGDGEFLSKRLNSVSSQIKGRRTQFVNTGNISDTCKFYICRYKHNRFKFGITAVDIEFRSSIFNKGTRHYHELFSGTRLEVANLEALIKLKFNQINEDFLDRDFKIFKRYFRESLTELNLSIRV